MAGVAGQVRDEVLGEVFGSLSTSAASGFDLLAGVLEGFLVSPAELAGGEDEDIGGRGEAAPGMGFIM